MESRKRERKTEIVKKPPDYLMVAGGEGVISKEDLRIKIRSFPQLADFKTRSYLNYTASIPLRFNRTTGYYEPAELGDVVTSHTHGYYYPTEPTALVDAGWYDRRLNKRRHLMSALYDEDGNALRIYVSGDAKGLISYGSVTTRPIGDFRVNLVDTSGRLLVKTYNTGGANIYFWKDTSVGAGATSASVSIHGLLGTILYMKSSTSNTFRIEMTIDDITWYEILSYTLTAGEAITDMIYTGWAKIRVKVDSAGVVTCWIFGYGNI